MKTIYTDRYALRLWIWLLLGAWFLFHAATPPADWKSVIWLAGSAFWFWLAFKELARAALRRDDDPSKLPTMLEITNLNAPGAAQ